jgi:hypothetical protein
LGRRESVREKQEEVLLEPTFSQRNMNAAEVQAGGDISDRGGDPSCVVRTGTTPVVLPGRGGDTSCVVMMGALRLMTYISLSDDISPTAVLDIETGATPVVLS